MICRRSVEKMENIDVDYAGVERWEQLTSVV